MKRFIAKSFDFSGVRAEFQLPTDYPQAALEEAQHATDRLSAGRTDRTGIPFVTIDPPGSMDLDQAMHLVAHDGGFTVHYAIADVGAVVVPGGALEAETWARGMTVYLPDGTVPLHPPVLSEGSASLLPNEVRPAALWTIELDATGEPTSTTVERALVRSVARLDYEGVDADFKTGSAHPSITALKPIGELRLARARDRGAIELRLPDQEVELSGDGDWKLTIRNETPVDGWNAEISLLTGVCAAGLMLDAKVGLLRTLPPADPESVDDLRKTARLLGVGWGEKVGSGEFLLGLDVSQASSLVLMNEATRLLRGAGYVAFDGSVPEQPLHAAIGLPYAHVTAPLRRLADRYATEVCLAICAKESIPDWARTKLEALPVTMKAADSKANKVERACVDQAEAELLLNRIGETFPAIVLRDASGHRDAEVFIADPPVIAECEGAPTEGEQVQVTLIQADVALRKVKFSATPRTPA